MPRRIALIALLLGILALANPVLADCASELSGLEGWTIVSATSVDGEFEGCDFDKVIRSMDGSAFRCSTYSYTYSFMPEAIIFAKTMDYQGNTYAMIKALIEGEVYDMSPVKVK